MTPTPAPPIVTDEHLPPASDGVHCFWCGEPKGSRHKRECVTWLKRVVVRAIIEYEVEVPMSWGAPDVEFHRNDGSWCANNLLTELQEQFPARGEACLCNATSFEFVGELDPACRPLPSAENDENSS